MNAYVLSTVLVGVCAVIAVIAGAIGWFYKRGGTEREMTLALQQNTEATHTLSGAFHSFREDVVGSLHSQDIRLTRVEAKLDDSSAANRNSSSPGRH